MTQTYRMELFDEQGSNPRLRWFSPTGPMVDRRLDRADVDALIDRVGDGYARNGPDLPGLGGELYRWLDGPTERWLAAARGGDQAMVVYVDAAERLRALPWELLFDQGFLAVHPTRSVTSVRAVSHRKSERDIAHRPLRMLMMASSPIGVEPVLDFEQEEGVILAATAGLVELVVEESGSLAGLAAMLSWYGPGYFDVLHLSGHAVPNQDGARFVMESPEGARSDHSAAEIGDAVQGRWPGLMFVSGCSTGAATESGLVASMAEALVEAGAPAVLGWALPVGDAAASGLAAALYGRLGQGAGIDEAVALARRSLFEDRRGDWHLLRLYADRGPLIPLVTPPGEKGRPRLRTRASSTLFLDAQGQVKVADRASFVGRRRELQMLLRALRPADPTSGEKVALLHGMGGLGKSTLTARLLDRMSTTHDQRAVWVGRVDEQEVLSLTSRLSLSDPDTDQAVTELLSRQGPTLADRLRFVLDGPLADTACLFVFDDFEDGNLEKDGPGYRCTPAALEVLVAFAAAIERTGSPSRVVVTSRYDFPLPAGVRVLRLSVSQLQGADLEKKLRLLPHLGPSSTVPAPVKERAIAAAAGVPRLLERLDSLVGTDPTDLAALFATIEDTAVEFREDLLLRDLLATLTTQARTAIALAAVYQIAVPLEAILALSPDHRIEAAVEAAVGVGLIQAGLHPSTNERRYLVSPLLRPLLATMDEQLDETDLVRAQDRGAQFLYDLWVEPEGQQP